MTSIITPVLNTPDIERLRRFYAGVFGATEATRVPAEGPLFYLGLSIGGEDLGLVDGKDAETGTTPRIILAIVVEDCDATLAKVEAAGGSILGPPNDMPWGHRVAHVHDPDGTMVNITQVL